MNKDGRPKSVVFAEARLKASFGELKQGAFEDRQLYEFLNRAFGDLKENPFVGIKIPKNLWPHEYVQKYGIDNLWKYDLPNAWRLVYTIQASSIRILAVILEWFDHKQYERRFGY